MEKRVNVLPITLHVRLLFHPHIHLSCHESLQAENGQNLLQWTIYSISSFIHLGGILICFLHYFPHYQVWPKQTHKCRHTIYIMALGSPFSHKRHFWWIIHEFFCGLCILTIFVLQVRCIFHGIVIVLTFIGVPIQFIKDNAVEYTMTRDSGRSIHTTSVSNSGKVEQPSPSLTIHFLVSPHLLV
jgi:hypothetical protein